MDEDLELICRDRNVTVRHAPAFLDVFPEYIEVCKGRTVTINIAPPVDPGSAKTQPASGCPGETEWLERKNEERDKIVIEIPDTDTTALGEYKYSITIDGVGTLDPRFRIIR